MLLAHWSPRALAKLQESPVQAICLLILLSSYSVANTSLIIQVRFTRIAETRVSLQPDLVYFSGIHWTCFTSHPIGPHPSVLPPSLGLSLPGCMDTKIKCIHCIKPLLDEFQCCFKNNLRWYPGAYFSVGLLILAMGLKDYTLYTVQR